MKAIATQAGSKTDFNKDYEYTNWTEVRRCTTEFLFSLEWLYREHQEFASTSMNGSQKFKLLQHKEDKWKPRQMKTPLKKK